jgi:hypothetical protein
MSSPIYLLSSTPEEELVLANCPPNTNFIFDSNVTLLAQRSQQTPSQQNSQLVALLKASRRRVDKYWRKRRAHIPVSIAYAIFELTEQYQKPNKPLYCSKVMQFYLEVFGVADVDPNWVASWYGDLAGFIQSTMSSTEQIVESAISLLPHPSDYSLAKGETAFRGFVDWREKNLHKLDAFPCIFAAIVLSAAMGNQDAGAFLKLRDLEKYGVEKTSRNIAWDLIFVQAASMHSIFGSNAETIFCTADKRLAYLARNILPGMKSSYLQTMRMAHTGAHKISPQAFGIDRLTKSALANRRVSEDLLRLVAVIEAAAKEFSIVDPVSRSLMPFQIR